MEIITVKTAETKVTKDQKTYQSITDQAGVKYSNWGPVMAEGLAYEVEITTKGDFKNIKSHKPVKDDLKPSVKPQQVPDPKDMPPKSLTEPSGGESGIKPPEHKISPQEEGMFWKEMGECLRKDGFFGADVQKTLKRFYCAKMYGVCGVKIEDLKTQKEG